jgi:hypothetical protein
LVKLRYFVGFSLEETAAALGLSPRSAGRLWAFSRAWQRHAIEIERGRRGQAEVRSAQ